MDTIFRIIEKNSLQIIEVGNEVAPEDIISKSIVRGELIRINIAEKFQISPARAKSTITVQVGDELTAGQTIASFKAIFGLINESVLSPIDGIVENINFNSSTVEIRCHDSNVTVLSMVTGKVISVLEDRVEIQPKSPVINCKVGFGDIVCGNLTTLEKFSKNTKKQILYLRSFKDQQEFIQNNDKYLLNSLGVICPYINVELTKFLANSNNPLVDKVKPKLSFVSVYGFSANEFKNIDIEILDTKIGSTTTIFPQTQIRAGSIRPYIV
jgi:hypothetical protein